LTHIFLIILNYLMAKMLSLFNHKVTVCHVLMGIYLSVLVNSFRLFAPFIYVMDETPSAQSNSSDDHLISGLTHGSSKHAYKH